MRSAWRGAFWGNTGRSVNEPRGDRAAIHYPRSAMLNPGETFERYTVEALLGQGGMGAVYRVFDPRLGRRVALKVISDRAADTEADARLKREAQAAASLAHPNAVAIFDVGDHDGMPFIVMELVQGNTLRQAVGASLPISARLSQLGDVARALAEAHRRGIVHRDVKPENVMVRDDGVVKVLDFGIARRTSAAADPHANTQTPALSTLTAAGSLLGTPVYMAPEQIRCDPLDGRADQFSWGVVAYELLAGQLPWRPSKDGMAVLASVLTDTADGAPLARAGVSPAVQAIVLRTLEKRASDRFGSMDDLLRALDAAAKGDPLPAEKAPPGVTEVQQFSTGEIRDVLGKALEIEARKKGSTKLGFEDLLAVAAEVGVDAESLREASRALRAEATMGDPERVPQPPPAGAAAIVSAPPTDVARRDAWLRQQRLIFLRHAGVYAIVNVALLVLGLVLLRAYTPWWVWFLPALAWGVGLAIHGLVALTQNETDWKEHDEGVRWWRERQRQRHEERMVRQRKRVPALAEPDLAHGRIRVAAAADTERERAAEEEAIGEEPRRQRRRRGGRGG
jgi:serine/threonine-protein kinase